MKHIGTSSSAAWPAMLREAACSRHVDQSVTLGRNPFLDAASCSLWSLCKPCWSSNNWISDITESHLTAAAPAPRHLVIATGCLHPLLRSLTSPAAAIHLPAPAPALALPQCFCSCYPPSSPCHCAGSTHPSLSASGMAPLDLRVRRLRASLLLASLQGGGWGKDTDDLGQGSMSQGGMRDARVHRLRASLLLASLQGGRLRRASNEVRNGWGWGRRM